MGAAALCRNPRNATTNPMFDDRTARDRQAPDAPDAQPGDPHALFEAWFAEARASEPNDPEAVALATADMRGRPSVRMVLLKGHDERGFVFYTNTGSRKGGELAANPRAALLFHWKTLRRQVRVEGAVAPVTQAETAAYFATRSRESQLGAWASSQSDPLAGRATLEERYAAMVARFQGVEVPCPPFWGGFRVVPERFEFWRDGAHRLHQRLTFARNRGGWTTGLLYP